MAHISRFPLLRHLRTSPTTYVRHTRAGRLAHEGVGAAFWFRPLRAAISEVPVDDRELPLLFHARTADFQDVTVQASVTYRFADPATAAARIDFSIDPESGRWTSAPLEQVAGLLTETAQQHALDLLVRTPLPAALTGGVPAVRAAVTTGLTADARLAQTGLETVDVRVVAIRPEPEVERALRTPARERVQQDADRATYERRAVAVERERAIGENELQSRIELARREEQLVAQQGANARRQAQEAAAAGRVEAEAAAERRLTQARADAEARVGLGEADAAAEAAALTVYGDAGADVLRVLALRDLARNLPHVDNLVLSPDVVTTALARLAGTAPLGSAAS